MVLSHGADAERLRGVGRQLIASAQTLDDVAVTGRGMTQTLAEHWSGADLEHFVGQGWPGVEAVLHSASEMVRGMGEGAARNADEQDGVSGGSAPAGGHVPGPLPPGAQGSPMYEGGEGPDYGRLDHEVYTAYLELEQHEREAVLQEIVNREAAEAGIDPPPEIIFDPELEEQGYAGSWSAATQELRINPTTVANDPRMALNTAVHEMRHAEQHAVVDEATPNWLARLFGAEIEAPEGYDQGEVESWAENQERGNYVRPPTEEEAATMTQSEIDEQWQAYYDQPVEEDAREAGERFIDDLAPEEFDELVEASRS